ncbi:hypothetical protein HYU09_00380 [Candidatus Woesearchaeota archaeon]|nr:hypothetical protein [Candidatus Woesearchaeota archaeon]
MMPLAMAVNEDGEIISGGKLLITDVDVKVDGSSHNNIDFGDRIKREAKPGSTVEFRIEVKNNFTDDKGLEIEDIEVVVTIDDIDDGDELDEEAKEFDLKAGKDKKVNLEFKIPLEVEDDTFDVLIEVEGRDENRTIHKVIYELELEVEKEKHEIRFTRNAVTPSEIQCSRTVQLSTAVINTGRDDEDEAVLEVTNAELGINFRETFDLSNDPFDSDSKFSKTFTYAVPTDVPPEVYSIQSRVTYENGRSVKTDTVDLVVGTCQLKEEEEHEEAEPKDEVVVVQPTQQTTPGTTQPVTTPILTQTKEPSFFETDEFVIALIAGEILLVIIIILLSVFLFKRKQN